MIADEILSKADCKVPGASHLYDDLLTYVQRKYSESPRETQATIFSLAYTKACRAKKRRINGIYQKPISDADKVRFDEQIQTVIAGLQGDAEYESFCNDALALFDNLKNQAYATVLNKVDTSIKESLKPLISPVPKPFWRTALGFIGDSAHHSVVILLSAFWLTLLGSILTWLVPMLMKNIVHLIEEAFAPLTK